MPSPALLLLCNTLDILIRQQRAGRKSRSPQSFSPFGYISWKELQQVLLAHLSMSFAIFKCLHTPHRDTAGQERYASLAPLYYRGASAATVVYDITNAESFQKAKHWVSELQKNASGAIGELIGGAERLSMACRTCPSASWTLPPGIATV